MTRNTASQSPSNPSVNQIKAAESTESDEEIQNTVAHNRRVAHDIFNAGKKSRVWKDMDFTSRHIVDGMTPTHKKTYANTNQDAPQLSVIICTYNPDPELFSWMLSSLALQTMPVDQYEIIIVDNNSQPAFKLEGKISQYRLPIKIIREKNQGLTYARSTGIHHARADLFVFVDDDNFLQPPYLEEALRIARDNHEIGHFGGISYARLASPVTSWKKPLLAHLGVRDYGDEEITKVANSWGEWEPIGAGMVCRRCVAEAYADLVENDSRAGMLGRSGKILLSGEDSLFARMAFKLNLACSYQPSLKLYHYMPTKRLTFRYLFKILEGHGRSYVRLAKIMDQNTPVQKSMGAYIYLFRMLLFRFIKEGRIGLIHWGWDLGYFKDSRMGDKKI